MSFEFTIDRSRWLRGEGSDASSLLRPTDRKQCCVGMFGTALGISDKELENAKEVEDVLSGQWPKWCDSIAMGDFYELNDDEDVADSYREDALAEMFASHDVKVTFVDGESR